MKRFKFLVYAQQLGGNLFTIVTALALFFYWPQSMARRARKV
ncbi:MAG: hypothetical protein ACR2FM_00825 [Candidatus Saccharimonadales bacterium]